MPPIETRKRKQDAVLWAYSGSDRDGDITVSSTKIALKVRWQIGKVQQRNTDSELVTVDGLAVVDREIAVHSIMWKGKVADAVEPYSNLWEVVDYSEIPSLKANRFRRIVLLNRYSNELPITT